MFLDMFRVYKVPTYLGYTGYTLYRVNRVCQDMFLYIFMHLDVEQGDQL